MAKGQDCAPLVHTGAELTSASYSCIIDCMNIWHCPQGSLQSLKQQTELTVVYLGCTDDKHAARHSYEALTAGNVLQHYIDTLRTSG